MSRLALGILWVVVLCGALHAQGLTFTDITSTAGVTGTPSFGNMYTGGGSVGDFDRDGDQDLLLPMGPQIADRLFLNTGGGSFTDVAAAWGVNALHIGAASAVGDYDDDGWLDIYLLSLGTPPGSPGKHRLYHNLGGTGFAQVVTVVGVAFTSQVLASGYGTCFGDTDMDGDLDIVATAWLPLANGNRIFRNNGNGTFSNVTSLAVGTALATVRGFTPSLFDMDGDLDPELLLAGDYHTSRYFVNNGDGTFTDGTVASGTGAGVDGMGATIADFNGDLLPDWYVTGVWEDGGCSSGNVLYINQGNNTFSETALAAGVNDGGWGWGVVSTDLDLDGDADILENNGWPDPMVPAGDPACTHDPLSQWIGEPAYLWLNDGDGEHFTESHAACNINYALDGRGALNFDADGDGDQDVALSSTAGPFKLYRNDISGPDHHSLRVLLDSLKKPGIPADGLGSKVYVTVDGTTQMAPVMSRTSYISACELSAVFGLGAAPAVDQLRVEWPDGTRTYFDAVLCDQTITVSHHGWKMLGGGLAGAGGIQPVFAGQGDLTGNTLIALHLTSAAPSAPAAFFIGLSQVNAPFKGGILVPSPDFVVPGFFTSPSGGLFLPALWPTGLPPQLVLTMQVWVSDAGAIHGVSGSNAVQVTTF